MFRLTTALSAGLLVVTTALAAAQQQPEATAGAGPSAQQAEPAPQAQPAAPAAKAARPADAPAAERPSRKATNVRIDVTVTEQEGSKAPRSKHLTLTAADGSGAQIRNLPEVSTPGPVREAEFSIDARPELLDTTRVRLWLSMEYNVVDPTAEKAARNQLRSRQELVLESGKPMVVSETTDPITERRVTVTVTATVLR